MVSHVPGHRGGQTTRSTRACKTYLPLGAAVAGCATLRRLKWVETYRWSSESAGSGFSVLVARWVSRSKDGEQGAWSLRPPDDWSNERSRPRVLTRAFEDVALAGVLPLVVRERAGDAYEDGPEAPSDDSGERIGEQHRAGIKPGVF